MHAIQSQATDQDNGVRALKLTNREYPADLASALCRTARERAARRDGTRIVGRYCPEWAVLLFCVGCWFVIPI